VPEHFEVCKLHKRCGLEVHVVGPYFFPTFFYALGDVLSLVAFVVAEASNEVEERFFEPVVQSASTIRSLNVLEAYILATPQVTSRSRVSRYLSARGGVKRWERVDGGQ
jgi:hypothetical protein